jgi:hypothetical protein
VGINILAGRNAEHKQRHSVAGYVYPALRLKTPLCGNNPTRWANHPPAWYHPAGAKTMAKKKKKKKTAPKQQTRSVRGQQIVFVIIAVIVIASFLLSLVS